MLFPKVISISLIEVPDVLEVHEVPLSDEVRMVPESPTTKKVPQVYLPVDQNFSSFWENYYSVNVIPFKDSFVPEVLVVQVVPLDEVNILPFKVTATKIPFPYAI